MKYVRRDVADFSEICHITPSIIDFIDLLTVHENTRVQYSVLNSVF